MMGWEARSGTKTHGNAVASTCVYFGVQTVRVK
jgi:hypothetical protein